MFIYGFRFVVIMSLAFISGCSVSHTSLYLDNSVCAKSMSNGLVATISPDWEDETKNASDKINLEQKLGLFLYAQKLKGVKS